MIVYNELIAITAGAGLLGFAAFLADLIRNKRIDSEGWAGFFGVTGLVLLALGLHTTVTWPYGGDGFEYANIAFGQPAAGFGALLLLAAVYLWRHRALFEGDVEHRQRHRHRRVEAGRHLRRCPRARHGGAGHQLRPLPARRGSARGTDQRPLRPPADPRGPVPRRTVGDRRRRVHCSSRSRCGPTGPSLLRWAVWAWVVGGVVFLLFGAMNFYTHIGMYYNLAEGTMHKW